MKEIKLPPGVTTITVDDDPNDTHPVKMDHEDGRKTEAKSVIWDDEPAPDGTWKIEDERPRSSPTPAPSAP